MTKGYLDLEDNGKIYFENQGTGENIVFIHGFSFDSSTWKHQMQHFADKYATLVYDARGFGKSSLPDGPYLPADDLCELLDFLEIRKAHIVGLSMGGGIATEFTLKYPDRVLSLSLFDSDLSGFDSTVNWDVHVKSDGLDIAKQNWLNHNLFNGTRSNKLVMESIDKAVGVYSGWHWIYEDPRLYLEPSSLERLEEIDVPTLILVGENDLDYFLTIAKLLNRKIRNSKLAILKEAGHVVNMKNPELCNDYLEKLFSSV